NAQRLPNGNTFIATNNELLEVDRAGKTIWNRQYPNIWAACKGRDGIITCMTSDGRCIRLAANGKEKAFPFAPNAGISGGIDALPLGRVLVAENNTGTVSEIDGEGKVYWQTKMPGVSSATRLPNGHTLVASHPNRNVTELNRAGDVVWEYKG